MKRLILHHFQCETRKVLSTVVCRELFPVALIHVGRSPPLGILLYRIRQKPYAFLCLLLERENQLMPLLMGILQLTVCTFHVCDSVCIYLCARPAEASSLNDDSWELLFCLVRRKTMESLLTVPFPEKQLIELINEHCRRIIIRWLFRVRRTYCPWQDGC